MMRQPLWKALVSVCFLAFILIAVPQPAAQAGFFDRIKDIYNTPEKISELEQQYIEAKEALVDQRQLLEDSARKQQELIEQNEQFRQQNEQLIAKNASMQAEMERMKLDRQSFLSKLMNTVIILAALFVAYIVSIRVWRYMIWRKQRSANGRGMGG
jgi:ABC-type multidrug transport system fused ATPase/permease subunit